MTINRVRGSSMVAAVATTLLLGGVVSGCSSVTSGSAIADPAATALVPAVTSIQLSFRSVDTERTVSGSSSTPEPSAAPAPTVVELAALKATRQSTDSATQTRALSALDCSKPDPLATHADPALPLVACDRDGKRKFILGPAFVTGEEVTGAKADTDPGTNVSVTITLTPAAKTLFAEYTGAHIGKQLSFVVDTRVQSAPRISSAIVSGNVSISGGFTRAEADELVSRISDR